VHDVVPADHRAPATHPHTETVLHLPGRSLYWPPLITIAVAAGRGEDLVPQCFRRLEREDELKVVVSPHGEYPCHQPVVAATVAVAGEQDVRGTPACVGRAQERAVSGDGVAQAKAPVLVMAAAAPCHEQDEPVAGAQQLPVQTSVNAAAAGAGPGPGRYQGVRGGSLVVVVVAAAAATVVVFPWEHRLERPRRRSPQARCVSVVVEDAEEEVEPECRRVVHDGAPPWLADAGAAEDGGGLKVEQDLDEDVGR